MTTLIWLGASSIIWGGALCVAALLLQRHSDLSGRARQWIWRGASLVIANSIVLAHRDFGGFWFGGDGGGETRLGYFNCRFGRIGDRYEDLSTRLPDWMVAVEDDVNPRIEQLSRDPFGRGAESFWIPVKAPVPL